MPKLLVITGASGFMGWHASRFALSTNHYDKILATDIRRPPNDHPLYTFRNPPNSKSRLCFIETDITDKEGVENIKLWLSAHPDYEVYIWHLGGLFNYSAARELLYKVNVTGTRNLLEAAHALNKSGTTVKRFIFWSGGVVYGDFNHPEGQLPATENYPTKPQNDYGWSKLEAENWCLHYYENFGLPITIMRLAAVYGPYSRYGMGAAITLNASGQLEPVIVGSGRNKTAMIHAEDVMRIAHFLGNQPEANGEIYNVVDETPYTLAEQARFLGHHLNNEPFKRFRMPQWVFKLLIKMVEKKVERLGAIPIVDPGLGEMILLNSWMSNAKLMKLAQKKLGPYDALFRYPNTLIGLKQTIDWFREEGWI